MKTIWLTAMLGLGLAGVLIAQDQEPKAAANVEAAPAQAPPPPPPPATQQSLAFQATMLSRILGTPVTIDGAIPRAFKTGKPLQLINPFAPKEYGDGYDNVTVDRDRNKATGFSIFNIKF